MQRIITALLLLIVASIGYADVKKDASKFDPDEAIAEIQQHRKQMTELLKPIKTRADAERVAAKLAEHGDRIVVLEKALGQFEAKLIGTEKRDYIDKMVKKHWARQQEIKRDFGKALVHLQLELPEAYRPLQDNALFKRYREDGMETVRKTFEAFDRSIQIYIENNGKTPKSLKKVAESVLSTIGPEGLLDPWGRPFRYDPDGKQNDGKKPDIWMVDPLDGKTVIGNWPK